MSPNTQTALTPRQRLARGLSYTAMGPVDVTRGVVGLGVHTAQAGAGSLRRRYREGQLAQNVGAAQETLADEFAAAQEVVAGLPQALRDARRTRQCSRRRTWLIVAGAAALLAGGAAAFALVRRSARPAEPSPRPPSVEVQPRP